MSDDDEKLRGTIPFEDIDILTDEEEYEDATDLLVFVEDGAGVEEATNPFMPALTDATRQHSVPTDLLWKAMRPEQGWIHGYAHVVRNGLLRLDAQAAGQLAAGERVEVRVRRLKAQPDDEE